MWSAVRDVSIHAPRAGRDRCAALVWYAVSGFNPRAPRGARLPRLSYNTTIQAFQSTRPARGATQQLSVMAAGLIVSIHAPRAGRDLIPGVEIGDRNAFQSTRPARGATGSLPTGVLGGEFQSTRPARGATTACPR